MLKLAIFYYISPLKTLYPTYPFFYEGPPTHIHSTTPVSLQILEATFLCFLYSQVIFNSILDL